MIQQAIKKTVTGQHLTAEEAQQVMTEIMSGETGAAQTAALLTALRIKGETVDEIIGFVRVMRQKVTPVISKHRLLLDTCGTGGDGTNTFNVSTTAALVLAAAGAKVAKHGNRSVSSRSGSADVLEALGVQLNLTPEQAGKCLDEVGICFLFAPRLHPAMKHVAAVRREIGIRTVFNILGPLTNPAAAQSQVLGVYGDDLVDKMARVLAGLGTTRSFVLHGAGGLDELSTIGPANICEVWNGRLLKYTLNPAEFGFERAAPESLAGGDPVENAAITRNILNGEQGAKRDTVVLNVALGLMCVGLAIDFATGIKIAQQAIDSGTAATKLDELVKFTADAAGEVTG